MITPRPWRFSFEVAALIYDEAFNREVEAMFEADLSRSTPIDPAASHDKPRRWQFGVQLCRLMAPIL
jgi:phosphatidylserine/phosphatidylglycerophosphate/cardiolipin synthase-like enzyme